MFTKEAGMSWLFKQVFPINNSRTGLLCPLVGIVNLFSIRWKGSLHPAFGNAKSLNPYKLVRDRMRAVKIWKHCRAIRPVVFVRDGRGQEATSQLLYQALVNIHFNSFQPPHPETLQKRQDISKSKPSKQKTRPQNLLSPQFSKIKEKKILVLKRCMNYESGVFSSREPSNPETGKEANLSMPYLTPIKVSLRYHVYWVGSTRAPPCHDFLAEV